MTLPVRLARGGGDLRQPPRTRGWDQRLKKIAPPLEPSRCLVCGTWWVSEDEPEEQKRRAREGDMKRAVTLVLRVLRVLRVLHSCD